MIFLTLGVLCGLSGRQLPKKEEKNNPLNHFTGLLLLVVPYSNGWREVTRICASTRISIRRYVHSAVNGEVSDVEVRSVRYEVSSSGRVCRIEF